jgi:hypothetical protein
MSTGKRSKNWKRRSSRGLVLVGITALALAASPTALATGERGGPGAPSVQQLTYTFSLGLKPPMRLASWSD